MNIRLLVGTWALMASVVIALAIYRKSLSSRTDDTLHLADGETKMLSTQATVGHRLESVDRWGKSLTVAVVVYGLAVAAAYFYSVWEAGTKIVTG
jgi:hypothetical protein